jgi:hypothetical protein
VRLYLQPIYGPAGEKLSSIMFCYYRGASDNSVSANGTLRSAVLWHLKKDKANSQRQR